MRSFDERIAEINCRSEKIWKERKKRRKRLLLVCIPLAVCLTVFSALFLPKRLPAEQVPSDPATDGSILNASQVADLGTIKVSGPGIYKIYTEGSDVQQIVNVLFGCISTSSGNNSTINGAVVNEETKHDSNGDALFGAFSDSSHIEYTITLIPVWGHTYEWRLAGNTLQITSTDYTVTLTDAQVVLLKETLGIKEVSMNKRICITVLVTALLLAVLLIPIPGVPDGYGDSREYTALTYKVVHWNIPTGSGIYEKTALYCFPDNFKSIDKLWIKEEQTVVHKVTATIVEINGSSVLVRPLEGEDELRSSDKLSFSVANMAKIDPQVGSDVDIYYIGGIMETYPAQIQAIRWEMATDLRHREYTGQWLDKETAKQSGYDPANDIVITRIYSNCFFARAVIPMPYEIKVNGQLSQEWCVGDQVSCTYKNTYYDEQNHRMEADFLTVKPSDFELEEGVCYKPVIYLYPEEETEVSVELLLDGKLTCTYPAYNTGWKVTAAPDSTLTDANGQTYNYLYWEGETNAQWDMTKGFCVKGKDTAAFLEKALEKLGLNRREANEFIVYWLPLMEQNPYNIISFQTDTYADSAQLQITPTPDTMIRVFMAWRASDDFTKLEEQELTAPERTGFTVVEWGGTEVK